MNGLKCHAVVLRDLHLVHYNGNYRLLVKDRNLFMYVDNYQLYVTGSDYNIVSSRLQYQEKLAMSWYRGNFSLANTENNLVPRAFPLKKWVRREKALASAGHVYSLNIPEKLIYMQPAGFVLTEVERSNNGK